MSKLLAWSYALIVSVISALSLLGLILIIRAISDKLWSQEAAGWVQAIGSIVAIYGSFLLARQQHENERKLQQENENYARQQRYAIISGILRRVRTRFNAVVTSREGNDFYIALAEDVRKLRESIRPLEALPPFEMPSAKILMFSESIQGHVEDLTDALDLERNELLDHNNRIVGVDEEIEKLDQALDRAIRLCGSLSTLRP